jgi:hypothetical protein
MGIEKAPWTPCSTCGRNDLLDIDLLDLGQVPAQYIDPERDHEGDLFCPTCRTKVVSFEKAQNDETYMFYRMDFNSREKRRAAREKRIAEADPASERIRKARAAQRG